MKLGKKLLYACFMVIVMVLCLSAMPVEAEAATVASGYCGMVYYHIPDSHKTHTWTLDDSGTLTISGKGMMGEYNRDPQPWAKYRDQIVSVVIKPGTTYVGHCSFENCKNLKRVEFPDSLTEYGDYVFNNCDGLTNIAFVKCFSSIGRRMFGDCDGLVNITVPQGITVIGDEAFLNCKNLTSVVLPKGVKSIANSFNGCSKLKSINLPEGLTKIGDGAFYGCSSLETIDIPSTVKTLEAAFTASGLKKFELPAGMTSIPEGFFTSCSKLEEVVIPDTVKTIGRWMFDGCEKLKYVKLPAGITKIPEGMFMYCSSLDSIEIPESVKTIESYAFAECGKLKGIRIPTGQTEIGEYTFYNCDSLKTVVLPENLKKIDQYAFSECTKLETIVFPDTLKSIGEHAFSECSGLKELILPDSVTSVGESAFSNCIKLEKVELSKKLTKLEAGVFFWCKRLKTIVIPEGVQSIERHALHMCESLVSVVLPASLKNVDIAFDGCTALQFKCYMGTEEQWEKVKINSYNTNLLQAADHNWQEATHDKTACCTLCGTVKEVSYGKHKPKDVPGKEATCTEAGMSMGQVCADCGEVLLQQTVIPAKGHTLTHVQKKEASYEADGNREHWTCICGKWFADEQCTNEITDKLSVIWAKLIKVVITETVVKDAVAQAGSSETVALPLTPEVPNAPVHGVEIPVVSLEAVADSNKSVSIETTQATVVFDKTAQEAIVGEAGSNANIILQVTQVASQQLNEKQQKSIKEKNVQLVISAQILCNEETIKDFKGGKATVHIPFEVPKGEKGSDYKVIYIADDGTVEEIETTYRDGKLVVELAHFSEYAVVKTVNASTNTQWILWAGIGAAAVAVAAVVIIVIRKKKVAA